MKKRLESLETERKGYQDKQMESFRAREGLQQKIDSADMEVKTLRCSHNLLQSDIDKKKEVIEQTRNAMTMLEEENRNLTKVCHYKTNKIIYFLIPFVPVCFISHP